ncbi:hypothetical protein GPECTOR_466g381 [Gonium pectorale]|uniref:Uncharacterized protein n=1 Tax=Gonium pectorale TaxID=33097 RepID=A0A150FUZ0_GONPE|nr:hypothetical protein GPECTOR_466g381 [Gonium pectorale]|eukprot:KXZ41441.1 hypothetical protein GPECTOR_466g381 [Gonium pectorale]
MSILCGAGSAFSSTHLNETAQPGVPFANNAALGRIFIEGKPQLEHPAPRLAGLPQLAPRPAPAAAPGAGFNINIYTEHLSADFPGHFMFRSRRGTAAAAGALTMEVLDAFAQIAKTNLWNQALVTLVAEGRQWDPMGPDAPPPNNTLFIGNLGDAIVLAHLAAIFTAFCGFTEAKVTPIDGGDSKKANAY